MKLSSPTAITLFQLSVGFSCWLRAFVGFIIGFDVSIGFKVPSLGLAEDQGYWL